MPRGDGTGPMGMGPITGRGVGYCANFQRPGFMAFNGRAFPGRGWRNMYYATGLPGWARYGQSPAWGPNVAASEATYGPEQEKEILQREAEFTKRQLKEIERRLDELEGKE